MKKALLCLSLLGCLLAASWQDRAWLLTAAGLRPASFISEELPVQADTADLNGDGVPEEIYQANAKVELRQGQSVLWASPDSWQVRSASLGDLNRDGAQELVLVVWRPWQPWPVDRVLHYGGRINGFHNAEGLSCHLILIGWRGQAFGERWAGSALVDPLLVIAIADLDGDGLDDLAALEGGYAEAPGSPASSLVVWEWNGFGFTLVDRLPGRFRNLGVHSQGRAALLITTH